MVVVAAEESTVSEVGATTPVPRDPMVGFSPGTGDVAPFGSTDAVAQQQGSALGWTEESLSASEVEHLTGATEDSGDHVGVAGQAAHLAGAQRLSRTTEIVDIAGDMHLGQHVCGGQTLTEVREGKGDDDRGGVAAMQRKAAAVHRLEELDQSSSQLARVGNAGECVA